jgi:hypothetical protein
MRVTFCEPMFQLPITPGKHPIVLGRRPAFAAIAAFAAFSRTPSASTSTVPSVPLEHQRLYSSLEAQLDAFNPGTPPTSAATKFSGDLFLANSHRGDALLGTYSMEGISLFLDRLQSLGAQGVSIDIHENVLARSPRSAEYAAFYRRVAEEVRRRGLTLLVETQADFAQDFSGITFDQYRQARRRAIEVILAEMRPTYLGVAGEPDTEYRLTKFAELSTAEGYAAFVAFLLSGLNRGTTLIGAGSGSWDNPALVRDHFVKLPVDFIGIHIYPVNRDFLSRAAQLATAARAHGKRVIIGETWLFKATDGELLWAPPTLPFSRDVFSFWQPLDQKFMKKVADLARVNGIEYVSMFWTHYLFAYLDYDLKTRSLSYLQPQLQVSQRAVGNMRQGIFSPTGHYYRQLATGSAEWR